MSAQDAEFQHSGLLSDLNGYRSDPRLPAWLQLIYEPECASTNAEFKSWIRPMMDAAWEHPHTILLHTAFQSEGRGSRGRDWQQGGAGLDIALTLGIERSRVSSRCAALLGDPRLTLLAGSVCAAALEAACGLPIALKWPNDLLCGDPPRKAGGILCESAGGWIFIGVGVNVNSSAAQYPPELAELTTLFDCKGERLNLCELTVQLAAALANTFAQPVKESSAQPPSAAALMQQWLDRDCTGGKHYRLLRGSGMEVSALRVDSASGALICADADGNEFSVQSYTELEAVA